MMTRQPGRPRQRTAMPRLGCAGHHRKATRRRSAQPRANAHISEEPYGGAATVPFSDHLGCPPSSLLQWLWCAAGSEKNREGEKRKNGLGAAGHGAAIGPASVVARGHRRRRRTRAGTEGKGKGGARKKGCLGVAGHTGVTTAWRRTVRRAPGGGTAGSEPAQRKRRGSENEIRVLGDSTLGFTLSRSTEGRQI